MESKRGKLRQDDESTLGTDDAARRAGERAAEQTSHRRVSGLQALSPILEPLRRAVFGSEAD
ncbi:hypothetical protein GCM10007858_65970 [Bradyrhizobium liaoningense]|jgi:hypothetical protein|nr:hypothetical protein GCM10007858_65970 [Bradyrhizobium liaoningense]